MTAMIDFYSMGSPNVTKVYIALEELGLAYTVHPVDVFGGSQFDPAFVSLNPSAKVPVIVDNDGPGGKPYTVFESGAILLYLADKTGKLLPADTAARFDAIQWMMVQMTGLGPMFGQFVHFMRFAPAGNDYALSRYRTQVVRVLDVIDERLGRAAYLGGADYSVADIATFPWARNIEALLKIAPSAYPAIGRWIKTIEARPAVVRALAAVDAVRGKTTAFDKAQAPMLDKIFGRGTFAA
jgi:GST-like protein